MTSTASRPGYVFKAAPRVLAITMTLHHHTPSSCRVEDAVLYNGEQSARLLE